MPRQQYYSINRVKKQIDIWLKDLTVSGAFKQYLLTNVVATDRYHLLTTAVIKTLDALSRLPGTKAPEEVEDGKASVPDSDLPAEVRLYRAPEEDEEEEGTEGESEDNDIVRQLRGEV